MAATTIDISATGGLVSLRVTDLKHPESVTGVVWRYGADKSKEGKAGEFGTTLPDVPLGSPQSISGKLFYVVGGVLKMPDASTFSFQVLVSVLQAGKVVHQEVPADGGAGVSNGNDMPFSTLITLRAV